MDTDDFEMDDNSALYIEELRNDDPNLKINAVSKVSNIAKILGKPIYNPIVIRNLKFKVLQESKKN